MASPSRRRAYAVTDEDVSERRRKILDHAALALAAAGLEGCTFVRVAEATGFSVGMIQHYFRTRDKLVHATIDQRISETEAEWRASAAVAASPIERIGDLLQFSVEGDRSFDEAWGFWLEMYATARRDHHMREKLNATLGVWRQIFVEVLEEAAESGSISRAFAPAEHAQMLLAVIDGLALQTINGTYGLTPAGMRTLLRRHAAANLGIDERLLLRLGQPDH